MTIVSYGDSAIYQDGQGRRHEALGIVVIGPSGGVQDDTGATIFPDSFAITAVTRDFDGNLLTTTISDGTNSWVQTITRDANGYLATMSLWVRQ